MSSVFAHGSRQVFADMLSLREEQDKTSKKVRATNNNLEQHNTAVIVCISQ